MWRCVADLETDAPLPLPARPRAVRETVGPGLPRILELPDSRADALRVPLAFPDWKSRPEKRRALHQVVAVERRPGPQPLRLPKRLRVPGSVPVGRACEEADLQIWVARWADALLPYQSAAPCLRELGSLAEATLKKMLEGKAVATLKKRFSGWKLWCEFVAAQLLQPRNAGLAVVVAFFHGLAETPRCGEAVLCALKFAASFMCWDAFLADLKSPLVASWCKSDTHAARREALPLPLATVAAWETAALNLLRSKDSREIADGLMLTAFLILLWGALRFSDGQRFIVGDLECFHGIVRSRCWRTKSSSSDMPCGILCLGIFRDWSPAVLALKVRLQGSDFLIASSSGRPASYTFALGHFRRLLAQYGDMPIEEAGH